MLGRMPRAAGRDRVGAGVWSTLLHLLLVAGALYAAGEPSSGEPPRTPPDTSLIYLPPPPEAPARPQGPGGQGGAGGPERPVSEYALPALPRFPDVEGLPESTLPPLTLSNALEPGTRTADEARRALGQRGGGGGAGGGGEHSGLARDIHTGGTVARAVRLAPGSPAPAYPELLRRSGVEGIAVVRFVVDSSGRVEPGSLAVLSATHPAFAEAVERVLPRLRFIPAEHGGRRVRQLVEMPFSFTLSDDTGRAREKPR